MAITVLTGFAEAFAAVEATWSLQSAGMEVVLLARAGRRSAARKVRGVRVVEVTAPETSATQCLRDIEKLVSDGGLGAFLPLDDAALWVAGNARWRATVVAGPSPDAASWALDKSRQFDSARRAGLDVPESTVFECPELLAPVAYPCVLKATLPVALIGDTLVRPPGVVCSDATELAVARARLAPVPTVAQTMVNGVGEGVFGIFDGEHIRAVSGHRRIRMVNPQGSASSACGSIDVDPHLAEGVRRMLREVGWQGEFMAEFLRDRDGTAWFMELNGRAWGSLALARRRGFEYPAWTVQHALNLPLSPPAPIAADHVRCRHVGREITHLAFVARGPRSSALSQWPTLSRSVRDVLTVRRSDTFYNWNPRQPGILAIDTWRTLKEQLDGVRGRHGK